MSKRADVLREAAKILEPEGAWCQGSYAKDRESCNVNPDDDAACCWCPIGAIMLAEERLGYTGELTAPVFRSYLDQPASTWNDDPKRTQKQVVRALRRCADLLDPPTPTTQSAP